MSRGPDRVQGWVGVMGWLGLGLGRGQASRVGAGRVGVGRLLGLGCPKVGLFVNSPRVAA